MTATQIGVVVLGSLPILKIQSSCLVAGTSLSRCVLPLTDKTGCLLALGGFDLCTSEKVYCSGFASLAKHTLLFMERVAAEATSVAHT